jgi:hypothetical protein
LQKFDNLLFAINEYATIFCITLTHLFSFLDLMTTKHQA